MTPDLSSRLTALAKALIDQTAARVLVEPQQRSTGFWFGGGNIIRDEDGSLLLCGRYRNYGDSRTGTGAGERGLELALFRADGPEGAFSKVRHFNKADLTCAGREVVSIEGCALYRGRHGLELFVSTEKDVPYPGGFESYQKPGTGVWSIDHLAARGVEDLSPATLTEVVPCGPPAYLHCKDPVVTELPSGDLALIFCDHPLTWSSSNSGLSLRRSGAAPTEFEWQSYDILSRGPVWDIAATRITDRLPLPELGVSLFFYDGCECLRPLDENPAAVKRPRGYSCEELGGIAAAADADPLNPERISVLAPLFVSPHGTGCSRYVATLRTEEGIFATWQQSQEDLSQPLMGHFLPQEKVDEILRG